jgi:3-isopropylmalate/(R)-2-methylmalate dehydratase small subunit
VRLSVETVAELASRIVLDPQAHRLTVDVEQGVVYAAPSSQHPFELDGESRAMLLEGLDAIDLTLKHRADIDAFFASDRVARPWIYPDAAAMDRPL